MAPDNAWIISVLKTLKFRARRWLWFFILITLSIWFLASIIRASVGHKDIAWILTDLMALSGFFTVLLGIAWSIYVSVEPTSLLSRWNDAAIIDLTLHCRQDIEKNLQHIAHVSQLALATLFVTSTVFGFSYILKKSESCNFYLFCFSAYGHSCEFFVSSIICALLAGLRLGQLVSYGFIGGLLKDRNVPFDLTIEHPDRTGGASQIGTFYLMQASVLMIPALWLFVWLIVSSYSENYTNWWNYFLWLMLINMILFSLVFFAPVWKFRRMIVDWKQMNSAARIKTLRAELLKIRSTDNPNAWQRDRRLALARDLDVLVQLPNIPISPTTRRQLVTSLITSFILPIFVSLLFKALK